MNCGSDAQWPRSRVSPGGVVLLARPLGVATRSRWIYFQGDYFPPRAGSDVMIFGCYNKQTHKQTNKCKKRTDRTQGRGPRVEDFMIKLWNCMEKEMRRDGVSIGMTLR